MAKAVVENYNGYPAIMIDGKPYPPMLGTVSCHVGTETVEGQKKQLYDVAFDEEYLKRLGESGVKVFFLICDTEWLVPGAFKIFKKQAEMVLKAIPDAYFMLRIGLHPPVEWLEANPDEAYLCRDGSRNPISLRTESYKHPYFAMYSLCSSKWREAAGKALMETYDKIETLPFSNRIIGYFLAAGNTSEWYYTGVGCEDHSEAFRRNFEEYLRETYNNDVNALRDAWNEPDVTFEKPSIPTAAERSNLSVDTAIKTPANTQPSQPLSAPPKEEHHIGVFTNMDTSKKWYDYLRAWHLGTAKSVNYFARLIKERDPYKLTGAFYGSTGCVDFITGSTSAASLTILDEGNVDFFAAPTVYQNTQIGAFAGIREAADSFRLRNKMFIVEEDTRTHNENPYFADLYELFSTEDTINIMKRDFGRNLCEDLQAWWFDQHIGGGRYKGEEIYALISRQQTIAREAYEKNRIKQNEIAFIYDEESINAVSMRTNVQSIEFMRDYEISRIGASSDMYFHNDLSMENMPSYKLYVFCNCFVLTKKEREEIKAKLKKDNATAIWFYAPGVIDPESKPYFSVEHIKDLTGIEVCMDEVVVSPKFKINGETHALTEKLDKGQIYGRNYRYRLHNMNHGLLDDTQLLYPAFSSVDENALNLGYFLQNKKPAYTVKEMDGFTSIYIGSNHVRSDVLREAARFAGCHIFCESDDIIYASRNYVTIHAANTGEKTLYFPENCNPFEVYEEKVYGENTKQITFNMLKGETKTFQIK